MQILLDKNLELGVEADETLYLSEGERHIENVELNKKKAVFSASLSQLLPSSTDLKKKSFSYNSSYHSEFTGASFKNSENSYNSLTSVTVCDMGSILTGAIEATDLDFKPASCAELDGVESVFTVSDTSSLVNAKDIKINRVKSFDTLTKVKFGSTTNESVSSENSVNLKNIDDTNYFTNRNCLFSVSETYSDVFTNYKPYEPGNF